jgi:phage protein D
MGGKTNGAALVKEVFGEATLLIGDQPVLSQAEADQLARACLNRNLLRLVHGEGLCRGRPNLHPGQVIRIEGFGKRFSGQYYVTGTSHRHAPNQPYRTHFTVTRNAL